MYGLCHKELVFEKKRANEEEIYLKIKNLLLFLYC